MIYLVVKIMLHINPLGLTSFLELHNYVLIYVFYVLPIFL